MSSESVVNGYYGKVLTHGDFVRKGLPASFVEPWDAWLQEAIASSRQQLDGDWLNCYLTGPIYRFVLAPGICGAGWSGVMMPSVDKVGRYYPMTIAVMNEQGDNPFVVIQRQTEWFERLEAIALSSLADDFDLTTFDADLDLLVHDEQLKNCTEMAYDQTVNKQVSHSAWQGSIKEGKSIAGLFPSFLDDFLTEHYFSYSLWWTEGSELVEPSLLVCQGLPPFDGVSAMFDGDWERWGWEGQRYPFKQSI